MKPIYKLIGPVIFCITSNPNPIPYKELNQLNWQLYEQLYEQLHLQIESMVSGRRPW